MPSNHLRNLRARTSSASRRGSRRRCPAPCGLHLVSARLRAGSADSRRARCAPACDHRAASAPASAPPRRQGADEAQMARLQVSAFGIDEGERTGQRVLELAHVARPACARAARAEVTSVTPDRRRPRSREQLRHEQRQVLQPLAQRRHRDDRRREPVVQVLAELLRRRPARAQIAVGGRDDAHVDRRSLRAADAAHLAVSSARSRRGCRSSGSSPISSRNSVPPSARSKAPACSACGAGERAALVSEELALDQVGGHRAAVEDDERPSARAALAVQRLARRPCRCRSRR